MKKPELNVGDRCWMLDNGLITFVDITDKRRHCKGETIEFCMYSATRVVSQHAVEHAHRSDLFRCPEERDDLLKQLRSTIRRMRDYAEELESREPSYVPDPQKDDV